MYCHILRVRAIPTLESTDSMIKRTDNRVYFQMYYISFKEFHQAFEFINNHSFPDSWADTAWLKCRDINIHLLVMHPVAK